ncbi:MAG: hypothetical protein V4662_11885 [Verrucomicrobiota bacterium]
MKAEPKTRTAKKTAKAMKAPASPSAATQDPAPAPAPPAELDLEPWTVVVTQKAIKHGCGSGEVRITAHLKYRGRIMHTLTGAEAEARLKPMAASNNARSIVPVLHRRSYADLSEAARATMAAKRCNQDNTIKPFEA